MKTVLMAGSATNHPAGATTQYHIPSQGAIDWTTTEFFSVCPMAGSFEKLYVEYITTVDADSTKTATVRTGTSGGAMGDSALTASVSNGTTGNDTVNSAAVSAGDKVSIKVTGDANSDAEVYRMGMLFTGTADGQSPIMGGTEDTTATTGSEYHSLQGRNVWSGTETDKSQVFPSSGTLGPFYAELSAPLGVGDTATLTVRIGAAATALVITFTGAAQVTGNYVASTVAVAAGDRVGIEWSVTGGTPAAVKVGWGVVFTPDTNGESVQMHVSGSSSATANNYCHPSGRSVVSSTSTARAALTPSSDVVCKKFYADHNTAPGAGKSYIYNLLLEGVTAASITVAETATTVNDTSSTFTVVAGDNLTWELDPVSNPTQQGILRLGFVTYIAPAAAGTAKPSKLMLMGVG